MRPPPRSRKMTDKGAQFLIVNQARQLDVAIRNYNTLSAQLSQETHQSMDDALLQIENIKHMIRTCRDQILNAASGCALSSQLEDFLNSKNQVFSIFSGSRFCDLMKV